MLKEIILNGKSILRYSKNKPKYLLVQFIDENDEAGLEEEIRFIEASTDKDFAFAGIRTKDWNNELSPWEALPVFGKQGFGGGGIKNIDFLSENIDKIKEDFVLNKNIKIILGGYSLAGLFSLWAGYETELFSGIAAVSPSVWFDRWTDYIAGKKINSSVVYLSLGDKEAKTKNKKIAELEKCIEMQYNEFSKQKNLKNILEWNEGNHFQNVPLRMAKGFSWNLNNI